jgi:putative transposase
MVLIPKYCGKVLYGQLRQHLGQVLRKLVEQRTVGSNRGRLMPHHAHMMIAIPPKYAVSQVVGYIKDKSAIHLARL